MPGDDYKKAVLLQYVIDVAPDTDASPSQMLAALLDWTEDRATAAYEEAEKLGLVYRGDPAMPYFPKDTAGNCTCPACSIERDLAKEPTSWTN